LSTNRSILIVEDDFDELSHCVSLVRELGYDCAGVSNREDALEMLAVRVFEFILVDLFLSTGTGTDGADGIGLIRDACALRSPIVPIVMSSYPSKDLYFKAFDAGALYALKKPILNSDEIVMAVRFASEKKFAQRSDVHEPLKTEILKKYPEGLIFEAGTLRLIEVAAKNPGLPVAILGETGTGKEEVVRQIHKQRVSRGSPLPFVAVNCSTLDTDLANSLLFGHQKGAFSGAFKNTHGYVGEAHNGILFLDEIHSLPIASQRKLLRVMNDGSYTRVGETKEQKAIIQMIAASTIDLDEAVARGKMLLDLRMRLIGVEIRLLGLRDRIEDLRDLIEVFFAKQNIELSSENFEAILRRCSLFDWPGNIRQLNQSLHAMLALSAVVDSPPSVEFLPKFCGVRPRSSFV